MTADPHPPAPAAAVRPPLIAVLGARQAGKRALIATLLEEEEGISSGRDAGTGAPARPPSRPWTIDTKYYTAAVQVVSVRLGHDGGHEAAVAEEAAAGDDDDAAGADPGTTSPAALAAAAEAVVLVFDAGDEASFQVRAWDVCCTDGRLFSPSPPSLSHTSPFHTPHHQSARAWAEAAGPALDAVAVRLAVAAKADAAGVGRIGGIRPAWHGPAGEWAAATAFEWVDAAAGAPGGLDESALLAGGGEEDEEEEESAGPAEAVGTARVREALAAHMWPGLVRKAAVAARGRGGGGGGGGGALEPATTTMAARAPPSLLPENGGGDDDHDDDGFATLLAEATAARDRIRRLPDAERRAAAAAFASRLLAAMEEGGEDGGAGGNDSSDEDSE
jgi:hypothetical protein